ncbi:entericidin A/B family lipoprotein [Sphingobium subterraneum]|uniref:Putative small secreted protein n=1 Tax=Sphingobium subterraneum TaxID=627688 RepID=A0A841J299_9SPHN|nr:entericidin A/B family lipoprotein [Sphingobium subterraneum]MBB6125083.1 putative small secreted protein [Sphingobium subterraneum]
MKYAARPAVTAAALLGIALLGLSACNTVKGVGRDIESVGSAGEKAIKK